MSSLFIKQLLATAVIIAATTVAAGTVSAAPVMHTAVAAPAHSLVQPVRWVHRHGHRYWVGRHHR